MHRCLVPALVALAAALVLAGCGGGAPAAPGSADVSGAAAIEPATPSAGSVAPAPVTVPDGPSAQEVVDDFAASGLDVPKPRDNTAGNCPSLGCAQLITTDAVSVLRFDDAAAQQRYAAAFGDDAHGEGPIVLQYAAARTPEGQRAGYEARLRDFLAERE